MTRRILILALILISGYFVWQFSYDAFQHSMMYYHYLTNRPTAIGIEAGPVKVNISEATEWASVFKALVTVLGTYLGIKVINKYVK